MLFGAHFTNDGRVRAHVKRQPESLRQFRQSGIVANDHTGDWIVVPQIRKPLTKPCGRQAIIKPSEHGLKIDEIAPKFGCESGWLASNGAVDLATGLTVHLNTDSCNLHARTANSR